MFRFRCPGSIKVGTREVAQSTIYVGLIAHSLLEVSFCTQPFPTHSGVSWLQYPSLRHRRKNACSLARSAAEVKPAHAGAQQFGVTV